LNAAATANNDPCDENSR